MEKEKKSEVPGDLRTPKLLGVVLTGSVALLGVALLSVGVISVALLSDLTAFAGDGSRVIEPSIASSRGSMEIASPSDETLDELQGDPSSGYSRPDVPPPPSNDAPSGLLDLPSHQLEESSLQLEQPSPQLEEHGAVVASPELPVGAQHASPPLEVESLVPDAAQGGAPGVDEETAQFDNQSRAFESDQRRFDQAWANGRRHEDQARLIAKQLRSTLSGLDSAEHLGIRCAGELCEVEVWTGGPLERVVPRLAEWIVDQPGHSGGDPRSLEHPTDPDLVGVRIYVDVMQNGRGAAIF